MPENQAKFHSPSGKRLVLIVEDEIVNQDLLRLALQEEYDLLMAPDGQTAKAIIEEKAELLSLVLLDLNLPDIHGLDILRWIRSEPRLEWLPAIVLTSDKESEVESLNEGAMDFIPKPYPMPKVIVARIERIIKLSEDHYMLSSTERDALTGLYNQDFFFRHADQYDTHHRDVSMDAIVVDINHFHMINERYGKAYGDKVLKRLGEQIFSLVKDTSLACRQDADTFYIYCPHRDDYSDILDHLTSELTDETHRKTHVRLRMGIYSDVDKSINIESRFDRARLAANTVRSNFTKGFAIYDSALHESELFEERLIESFHDALAERQFVVFYQPKFDIRPSEPILNSAEALVRWNDPEIGMVSPGVFIPLFEKNGLIQELDSYVWREVASQLRDWKDRLGFSVPVSVNVSRVDMYDEDFVSNVCQLVSEYGLTPDDLLLEITESAYTDNSDQIVTTVKQLREAGFKVEMDDFGSGYSSLNMVSTLPIDALKLDMQFIRNAFKGRKDTRMLEVVLEIADSLMVASIAEGVETADQMFTLKALGCDIVQGYYFSKPVPPQEYEAFLMARREIQEEEHAVLKPKQNYKSQRMLNSQFEYESMHDPLTGLYNQEAFETLIKQGDLRNIALLVAEMEDDTLSDDRVCRAAAALRQYFRAVDFICRIGKCKFGIIMTRVQNTMGRQIEEKVDHINACLAGMPGSLPNDQLNFGVAFSERRDASESIVADAEKALDAVQDAVLERCRIY